MKYVLSPARDYVKISQEAAITALVQRFGLDKDPKERVKLYDTPMDPRHKLVPNDGDTVPTERFDYRSAVGSCLYLAQATRPDVAYSVMCLSRHLNNPGWEHVRAVKHLMRYLWRTRDLGLEYRHDPHFARVHFEAYQAQSLASPEHRSPKFSDAGVELDPILHSNYSDADYGGSFDGRSTSGFCFLLSGAVVRWGSKLQNVTALSTTESEVYAATEAAKELLFLRTLLSEFGHGDLSKPARLFEDNSACIAQGSDLRSRGKAKHYVLRLRFLQERVVGGEMYLAYCPTERMLADTFTKPLDSPRFQQLRDRMLGQARLES
ncbi:MAG: Ty1/Copia family ribonuclease HI [Bacteroidota bacterium]